jgi:hypothetical protein
MEQSIEPTIRWNLRADVFLVDFGNAHFAVSQTAALILCDALREAIREKNEREQRTVTCAALDKTYLAEDEPDKWKQRPLKHTEANKKMLP